MIRFCALCGQPIVEGQLYVELPTLPPWARPTWAAHSVCVAKRGRNGLEGSKRYELR